MKEEVTITIMIDLFFKLVTCHRFDFSNLKEDFRNKNRLLVNLKEWAVVHANQFSGVYRSLCEDPLARFTGWPSIFFMLVVEFCNVWPRIMVS